MPDNKQFVENLNRLLEPLENIPLEVGNISLKELFENRIASLGISQRQVEKLLNIERKSLIGILERTAKRVDVVNVLKLAGFLNLPADKLLQIYLSEMPSDSIGELEQARKSNFIISNFDLANLRKSKFIRNKSEFENIEERIRKFFGLNVIYDYTIKFIEPAFSRTKKPTNVLMRDFWVKSAYTHFQSINNPNVFDRDILVELIPKIRPYTMNVERGLLFVAQALFNAGVTLIFQPYLPTLQVRGATFSVDEKPCVVITDYNKNYPTLWFALLHELHHVLYDLDEIATRTFHLTGEPDLFLYQEDKANDFAREYLFAKDRSKYIEPFIYDELMVNEYAKQCQIHPSIIYNYINYDLNEKGDRYAWSRFKQHFPDVKLALKDLNTHPWEKETIAESVNQIRETIFNIA